MKKTLLFTNLFFLLIGASMAQTTHNISMVSGNVFSPANITINKNDIIVWTNDDVTAHTSTSGAGCTSNGLWDSGTLNAGETFSHTFTTAGTFPYHCAFHCSLGMVGQITVNDVGISGTTSAIALNLNLKSFPNPFSQTATIEFELKEGSSVKIELYDMLGQKLVTPLEAFLTSGQHSVDILASDLKEGVYVCKLSVNNFPAGTQYIVKSVGK